MAPGSRTTRRSFCVNFSVNIPKEQVEIAGARLDASSNKAPTSLEAPTLLLVPSSARVLFTIFMKVFMETTQAQALTETQERLLKAKTTETY